MSIIYAPANTAIKSPSATAPTKSSRLTLLSCPFHLLSDSKKRAPFGALSLLPENRRYLLEETNSG